MGVSAVDPGPPLQVCPSLQKAGKERRVSPSQEGLTALHFAAFAGSEQAAAALVFGEA